MRRALLVALLVLVWPAAGAEAATKCRSDFTLAETPGARLFGLAHGDDISLYACIKGRPHRFWKVSPATTPALVAHGRYGRRLAISLEEFADGGNGIWVGWIDVRTGRTSLRAVRGPSVPIDPEEADSGFIAHPDAVAVGKRGEVAWVYEAGGGKYEVFHRRANGPGRRIASVPKAELELPTLAVSGRTVSWRTVGEPRSAPLTPTAPLAAPAAARRRACGAGDVLLADGVVRVFRVPGGVFACGKRAVRLAGPKAQLLLARAGRVLAFAARGTVGSLQLRTRMLRTRALAGPRPAVLAPGADGGLAMLRGGVLSHLPAAGSRLGPPRELARLAAGELDPFTLAVRPAAVTWRTVGDSRQVQAPT